MKLNKKIHLTNFNIQLYALFSVFYKISIFRYIYIYFFELFSLVSVLMKIKIYY